jgi:serine/threonine protein kinase
VRASLNHPHIAQIYGQEESGEFRCLVLEFVDGETLQERLARGPIPMEEALEFARQIADALEAAHGRPGAVLYGTRRSLDGRIRHAE